MEIISHHHYNNSTNGNVIEINWTVYNPGFSGMRDETMTLHGNGLN